MKYRKVSLAFVFAVALATIIAAFSAQPIVRGNDDDSHDPSSRHVEGSWKIVLTFTTGPAAGTIAGDLRTYARGGGLVNSPPYAIPPLPMNITFSTAHGAWERTGNREFAATWLSHVFSDGQLVGTLKVSDVITLNHAGDEFDGRQSSIFFDLAGNPISATACASLHGTRINVETPDPSCP